MKRTVRLIFALIALVLCCVMTLTSCDSLIDKLPDSIKDVIVEIIGGETPPESLPHKCESICPECGMCLDSECAETACIRKCEGHVVVPPHECESVCSDCGKCLDTTCDESACAEKCEGHVAPHECESVCSDCGKCLDTTCDESACAEKCEGHVAPHECESVCPDCGKCLDMTCDESACVEKCEGHVPPHICESVCPECGKCLDKACTESACAEKCPGHTVAEGKWEDNYDIITIAEAIELAKAAGQDGTTERYYIRGTVKTVSNPGYGEMTVMDETGEIYVYGTYSLDGSLKYSEMTDKAVAGDEVLLHCILSTYNDQPQVKNARLIDYKHVEVEIDTSEYPVATVEEARAMEAGAKVRITGVVARITYANGYVPSGVILVDGNDSIYVYDGDVAGQVSIGNKIEVAGTKAYWILDTEKNNAEKFGYKGCNQLDNAILVSNDKGNHDITSADFEETTVKELLDIPVTEDVTSQIYKVNALVKKVPGNGFVNYYFYDIDGETGAYAYTQCNGGDFAWLDEFDGKICTVYITLLNAKSTSSDCYFRILPVEVVDEGYTFNTDNAAEYAVKYHGVGQFLDQYTGNPEIELVTSVDSELLGFSGATLTYSSSDTDVVYFTSENGKTVFNCGNGGTATVTVTGEYNGKTYSETVEITVVANEEQDTVTIEDVIEMEIGEEVVVRGIVGPSATNQPAFYLFDETGMIAVRMSNANDFSTFTIGNEVVIRGKRDAWGKNGAHSQICISNATVEANYYGEHQYNTDFFITDKTAQDFYNLDENVLTETCNVYVLKVKVEFYDGAYSSGLKLISGGTSISVYCSGAGQYSWLKQFDGQEVTVELAPCNWNTKSYYASCVLAVVLEDGTKVYNDYNFQ